MNPDDLFELSEKSVNYLLPTTFFVKNYLTRRNGGYTKKITYALHMRKNCQKFTTRVKRNLETSQIKPHEQHGNR